MRVIDLMSSLDVFSTLESLHDDTVRLHKAGAPARVVESAHNIYYALSTLANHGGDTTDNIVSDLISYTMRAAAAFDGAVADMGRSNTNGSLDDAMPVAKDYAEKLGVVTGLFVVGGEGNRG